MITMTISIQPHATLAGPLSQPRNEMEGLNFILGEG